MVTFNEESAPGRWGESHKGASNILLIDPRTRVHTISAATSCALNAHPVSIRNSNSFQICLLHSLWFIAKLCFPETYSEAIQSYGISVANLLYYRYK